MLRAPDVTVNMVISSGQPSHLAVVPANSRVAKTVAVPETLFGESINIQHDVADCFLDGGCESDTAPFPRIPLGPCVHDVN